MLATLRRLVIFVPSAVHANYMAKRSHGSPASSPPKKRGPDAPASGSSAPACPDCGGTSLLWCGGDEYCGDCGTVLDSVLLTADYGYSAQEELHRNYVPHQRRTGSRADPSDGRFHKIWNHRMAAEAHRSIGTLCATLGMHGLAERCQHIFDDAVRARMGAGARIAFGAGTAARVCACVYIGAREAGRALGLVDIAREAHVSVFLVGREVKHVLAALDMCLALPDPLLQAETAVNRLVGMATTARRDPALEGEILATVAATTKAAQRLPAQLLWFLADDPQLRPALVEATGALMEFDRACSRHTGVNPNTLICTALAIAVEHTFATSEHTDGRALKQGHRDVIIRLVALRNGAGHTTIAHHMAATQAALVQASAAVPWLVGMPITRNTVAVHALDIAFCYGQAQSWMFSMRAEPARDADQPATGEAASALPCLLATLGKAPAFARAERRRAHRARLLDADPPPAADDDREADVVGRLRQLGVARDALLTLSLATLEQMLPAAVRSHALTDAAREQLDLPTISAADMPDDEAATYLTDQP